MTRADAAEMAVTRANLLAAVEAERARLSRQTELDEAAGSLSAESVEALRACGALHMKLPRALGGLEADLVTQMAVLERLAAINPAAGWCAMVGATSLAMPGAFLPDAGIARMFPDGRIPLGAIVVTPSGLATPVEGGYRVSGRWGFASGVRHAEWISAVTRVERSPGAAPEIHMLVFPASDCRILDNWQVLGLKGTGSCDIVVEDLFVPLEMSFAVTAPPQRGGALYQIPLPAFVAYEHAGFALGLAQRMLDGLVEILKTKSRGYAPGGSRSADRGVIQRLIGHSEMRLRAARALAVAENEEVWAVASAGQTPTPALLCAVRSAAVYATEVAVAVAQDVFRHAGASVIYDGHHMQRLLRDLNVAAQHYMVADTAYEQLGRARLGLADVQAMA